MPGLRFSVLTKIIWHLIYEGIQQSNANTIFLHGSWNLGFQTGIKETIVSISTHMQISTNNHFIFKLPYVQSLIYNSGLQKIIEK